MVTREDEMDDRMTKTEHRSGRASERSTSDMIDDCFRHQHPEAYGRDPVPQVAVPWELQCGRDHLVTYAVSTVAEEPMGNPHARQLDSA